MKRQNLTRAWLTALVFALLLAFFTPAFAFAAESDSTAAETVSASGSGSEAATSGEANVSAESEISAGESENAGAAPENSGGDLSNAGDPPASAEDKGEAADGTFFGDIFAAIEEKSAEILSALAFIGSLIIMICYKKGFLPLVTEGVRALAAGVDGIKEKTSSFTESASAISEAMDERLGRSEDILRKMEGSLTSLEKRLAASESSKKENEAFKTVLSAEVDMLYEIFMSASLPQYLKDSVGERITAMRASLAGDGADESEN